MRLLNQQEVATTADRAAYRKCCERCGDTEWPCFYVDNLCRMCQARRRDEQRDQPTHR